MDLYRHNTQLILHKKAFEVAKYGPLIAIFNHSMFPIYVGSSKVLPKNAMYLYTGDIITFDGFHYYEIEIIELCSSL